MSKTTYRIVSNGRLYDTCKIYSNDYNNVLISFQNNKRKTNNSCNNMSFNVSLSLWKVPCKPALYFRTQEVTIFLLTLVCVGPDMHDICLTDAYQPLNPHL